MIEGSRRTPSSMLYAKLLEKIKPGKREVSRLRNRTVFLPDERLMGPIVDITGTEFLYRPQVRMLEDGMLEWLGNRDEEYVEPYKLDFSIPQGPVVVRTTPPKMIGFGTDDPNKNLNFSPNDPYLDEILEKGLTETPKVDSLKKLEDVTKWVHDQIPYNPKGGYKAREGRFSLGEVLEKKGAVCRHQAATEYALLTLQEVLSVKPVTYEQYNPAAQLKSLREGSPIPDNGFHMVLYVVVDDVDAWFRRFVTDPTNNLVLEEAEYKRKLMERVSVTFTMNKGHELQGKW